MRTHSGRPARSCVHNRSTGAACGECRGAYNRAFRWVETLIVKKSVAVAPGRLAWWM
jgi:hypothetical protein